MALKTFRFCQIARRELLRKRSVHVVREHFEVIHDAAIGQKISVFKAILGFALNLGV
jgi:hypothetical protein